MLERLRALYVFSLVAETQSFSRAAERLRITKSAVSKHVALLEAQLGVQLIVRTTRRLALTEAGERVYAASARMAGEAQAAQEAAHASGARIAGSLRLTAPSALARNYLMPGLHAFATQHPEISFELVAGDAFVDLVAERIDVALRVGGRNDANFVTRRVAPVEVFLVAAPSYLARQRAPRTPSDLAGHEWVVHSPSGTATRIRLSNGRQTSSVEGRGRILCNDGLTNVEACKAGFGILGVPDFEVAPEVQSGALVRLLPGWRLDDLALQLVFPPRQHVLARVRAFAEFVVERFRDPPWSCTGAKWPQPAAEAATSQRRGKK